MFVELAIAQRKIVNNSTPKGKLDYAEKGYHLAVMAGWAFVAGMLHENPTRLARHFSLKDVTSKDPLNAQALADGHHSSDPRANASNSQ
jgi:hypothetical protein